MYIPLIDGSVYYKHQHVADMFSGKVALPEVLHELRQLHVRLQQRAEHGAGQHCTLDIGIYTEELPEMSDWFGYPVNAMRNKALHLAETEVRGAPRSADAAGGGLN